jgi:molecular chaperone DnaK (HSP70)
MKVGIDLGTTNSALAYIDPREGGDQDFPPIAPGGIEAFTALPWFLAHERVNA